MKNQFLKCSCFLASLFLITACSNDDDSNGTPPIPPTPDAALIYVANQGNFNQGTASLTAYNVDEAVVFQNVFAAVNDEPLGDILQSIYLYNDELYLVVNNSNKIEICNPTSLERKRSLTGLDSPRHMLFLSDEKAYVSDLFAGGIHIVNPGNATYSALLSTGVWVENMVLHQGEVWATMAGSDKLITIHPDSDAITAEITLSAGPNTLVADANGDVWVLCQGNFAEVGPALFRVNGSTKELSASWPLGDGNAYGGTLCINPAGDELYYLFSGDVYRMSINDSALPGTHFIAGGSRNYYGFNVNDDSGDLALTNAVDFQSDGRVHIFNPEGVETLSFDAGIIPGFVAWRN